MSQLEQWANETRTAAANPDHEWDKAAIDWPQLNEESVVFEIGSFKGRWALQMAERYNPKLYCFEPQEWAYGVTHHVLKDYSAKVFNFGLGVETAVMSMGEFGTDACSFHRDTRETGAGRIRNIAVVMRELSIEHIEVCLINIEGYEYELVPYMLELGILPQFLMIQFHGEPEQEAILREQIGIYYSLKWDFGSVLACWEQI